MDAGLSSFPKFWGYVGAMLGHLGAMFAARYVDLSWGSLACCSNLGAMLVNLGAHLGAMLALEARKVEVQ